MSFDDRTAVLLMDYQAEIVARHARDRESVVSAAKTILEAARRRELTIVHVNVAFRPGHPEISDRNCGFARLREADALVEGSEGARVVPELEPHPGEAVVVKRRIGPFAETDLPIVLRARGVTQLVLLGVATSGVVLSAVREAADRDFALWVARDACADANPTLHGVLMTELFPTHAEVAAARELAGQIAE